VTETVFLHGIQTYIYVDVFVNEIDITTIFSHQRLKAYPLSLSFQQTKNTPIMYFQAFAITFAAVSAVQAVAVPRRSRESACNHYTIIDTRGNGTPQGPSAGFRIMNANIRMQVSGGTTYNTVYPAGVDLNSAPGTDAIVRHIHNTLDDNPDECFVLEGYSLGATATCDALPRLTGDSFRAVKAVFLIGNPERRAGLDSNVDSVGGGSTKNSNGILSSRGGIPEDWVSKTMDVCEFVSRSVVIDQVIYRHTC
jgi:hypothetical protein